ncbi:uncharacterized protein KNAG_0B06850 [Huiozyma naganishii CBS 8797]|uniref:Uncharacterized protein n=1 Tax=Huiozyma naganishii (strain ATCC MYA-139 / BCRC 22969 / CBS 8797 / KCTC 17520 / NBRC 10181 / NCYC 3082 / Yp74L-3) TaxID=1071383 RepID=J7S462_HUIN7|nr:hypothetical protein KNAG_0B06850 [Kazachstania naganishii CBS 8797]CCK69109.1 hypothetical protein KNAG_0B06850 [Kazachstania naganishii CBS 8797]
MRVAVVTGASSGIGYAIVKELADHGDFQIYACARRTKPILELSSLYSPRVVIPYELDISKPAEIVSFRDYLMAQHHVGGIDILYNNAGVACSVPALDVTNDIVTDCFQVNVFGHVNMTRELSPLVIQCKGTIAFTGSIAAILPVPFITVYSASKAAIHQYARTLHLEMKPLGVRVINFVTGAVATDIGDPRPVLEDSLYNTPEGLRSFHSRDNAVKNGTAPSVYAKQVVHDILDHLTSAPDIYRGRFVTVARILVSILPIKLLSWLFFTMARMGSISPGSKSK